MATRIALKSTSGEWRRARSSPTVREGLSIANEALLDSRATAPNAQADVNEKPASGFLGAGLLICDGSDEQGYEA